MSGEKTSPRTGTVRMDEEHQRCHITFPSVIQPGAWKLNLAFRGTLNDKLRGFYRSSYKDEQGNSHSLAATQFEATDARRAFPCWDEPQFKAVFAAFYGVSGRLRSAGAPEHQPWLIGYRGQFLGKEVILFEPGSRYESVETATLAVKDADGSERLIRYKRRRFIPSPEGSTILLEHVVVQGDRLDNLTALYLGDPLQFWRVCDANVALHPEELTGEIGRTIRVALPRLGG